MIRWITGILSLLLMFGSAQAEPLNIRVGWSTMPGHMIPVLFLNPGILKHYGQSYTVEPVLFRGSAPQLTALAAGEIDLIASSPATFALAILNAGLDVRVVADIIQDGVPGYHSETWLVRADSGISKPADLKGKRIATNAIGSASDTALRAMMLKNGLQDRRDYVTIQAAFPSMLALLEQGKVDAAPILMPGLTAALQNPKYKALFQAKDAQGVSDLVFLIGQQGFINKNRAAMADFIEDYIRAMRWFSAPENREKGLKIIGDFMKIQPTDLGHLFTGQDYFRDPFEMPNLKSIQSTVDVAHEAGILPGSVDVVKYSDLSMIDEAKKRIATNP
jgi:NitT/TauT family transport system substrate-binding protein